MKHCARDGPVGGDRVPAHHPELDGLAAFSADQPLLLLSDFPPDAQGGGAVILRSLLTDEDRRRIVWVTLSEYHSAGDDGIVSLAPRERRSMLRDATLRGPALRRTVRSIMNDRGARAAWIVAHGAAVHVGAGVVDSRIPVHVTVHDDPAWLWLTRRYLPLAPLLGRDLRSLLSRARSLDVVSRPMADRYRRLHSGEITIVHRGLGEAVEPSPSYRVEDMSVAVLGSTYGLDEVRVLGEALEQLGRELGTPARLTVIGGGDPSRLRQALPSGVALDLPGHLDERAGIARLREAFLLYLSYPFSRRGKVLRTTSFPTKLSTYVLAARPMLLHMPADSSVAFLGGTSPYATLWDSRASEDGANLIARLWRDERMRESFHADAEEVRMRHFDLPSNRRALAGALNALVT